MPPGLISSAAPGKKAAPKAPARRRPPPQPTAPAPSAQAQRQTPVPGTRRSATPSVAAASPPPPTLTPVVEQRQPPVQHEPPPTKEPREPPASEPAREPEVDIPPPVVERPKQGVDDAPVVEKAGSHRDGPRPIVLPTPEPTQTEQQPDSDQQPRDRPEQGRKRSSAGAEERLQNYNVTQEPAVASQPDGAVQSSTADVTSSRIAANASADPAAKSTHASKRARAEASTFAAPRPVKRAKRTSTRSNFVTSGVANGEEPTSNAAGNPPEVQATGTTRTKRPQRKAAVAAKRKSAAKSAETITNSDDEDEVWESPRVEDAEVDTAEDQEGDRPVRRKPKKPRQPRKKKKAQPGEGEESVEAEGSEESDPEAHEVDPATLSMWEVSHSTRYGKMSARGKAMEEIDWDEVNAKRRAAAELIASGGQQPGADSVLPSTEGANGTVEAPGEGEEANNSGARGEQSRDVAAEDAPIREAENGIGFQVDADGNIVIAEDTITINRDAQATAAAAADRPVEDLNDLTVQVNRATWLNENRREATDRVPLWKWKSDPWSEEETDRFYDALCMFGTDFFIISKMFPPKTRRMIKSKFTREERLDPQRINDALNGKNTRRMSLEHYARETARDISVFTRYEGIEHAQAVINESMKERQAALTTAAEKEAEAEVERREKEKQKAARKGSKKGRKGKTATFGGLGGGGPEEGD